MADVYFDENSSIVQKIRKIETFMQELQITIEWDGYYLVFHDWENQKNAQSVSAEYVDDGNKSNAEFPHWLDGSRFRNQDT